MPADENQVETLWWLHEQIRELDRWRAELIRFPESRDPSTVEKLDSHRRWLEQQLARFGPTPSRN